MPNAHLAPTNDLGAITYNMLISSLKGNEILHRPKASHRRFRWFESIYGDDSLPSHDGARDMLIMCQMDRAKALLDQGADRFCLILSSESIIPEWLSEPTYRNRAILVKQHERFVQYDSFLQTVFANNLIWENEMDRVVFSKGGLRSLLAVSEMTLRNFVSITDTGHNLIASSRIIEPPADAVAYRRLIEDGCFDRETYERIEKKVLGASLKAGHHVIMPPNEECPYHTLHCPIHIGGSFLFHVTMVCAVGEIRCLEDVFDKFVKRVTSVATDFWRNTVNLEAPWHRVLISLIDEDSVTDRYLETQLSKTSIPDAKAFRLLYIPFDENMIRSEQTRAVEESRRLNEGQAYPFMYKGRLAVLLYSLSKEEASLSGRKVWQDFKRTMFDSFGVQAGASQLFFNIQELEKAYREAFSAYSLRGPLQREYVALFGNRSMPVFPFEHALKFYLLTEGHDDDIVDFAFSRCIINSLLDEDRESGTDIAQMVWLYISRGRNATEVGRLMHIHRNTVLYHLSRIEKRFDISFDSPLLRSRMVLDYQRLLLEEPIMSLPDISA